MLIVASPPRRSPCSDRRIGNAPLSRTLRFGGKTIRRSGAGVVQRTPPDTERGPEHGNGAGCRNPRGAVTPISLSCVPPHVRRWGEAAVLQTLSDTLASFVVVVVTVAGVLLILLPFAMGFGVVLHALL